MGDFADALAADAVLLVADAGLGVINAVRGAIAALGIEPPDRGDAQPLRRRPTSCTSPTATGSRDDDRLTVATDAAEAASMLAAI